MTKGSPCSVALRGSSVVTKKPFIVLCLFNFESPDTFTCSLRAISSACSIPRVRCKSLILYLSRRNCLSSVSDFTRYDTRLLCDIAVSIPSLSISSLHSPFNWLAGILSPSASLISFFICAAVSFIVSTLGISLLCSTVRLFQVCNYICSRSRYRKSENC